MTTSESRETRPPIEHFDAGKAVRRLLAGEPPQYIFGDNYVLLTIENLGAVLRPDPATRKVRFTLATAALMDAAQIVTEMPEQKPTSELQSIDIDVITPQVLSASFLKYTYKETQEAITNATDPSRADSTLSKALTKIRRYLPILDDEKAHLEIRKLLERQHATIEVTLPLYYELLSSMYERKFGFGTPPPFSAFQDMAVNSVGILGRMAAQGFDYLMTSDDRLKRNKYSLPYDPYEFNLSERPDGKLLVSVSRANLDLIDAAHKSLPQIYTKAMINCPANVAGVDDDSQSRSSHSFIEAVNLRALSHLKEATFS